MTDPDAGVHLTIVGSGTLVPDAERASAAHHVRAGAASVLFDCGSGTLHGLAAHGIAWQRLTHIAVSHFRYDHIGDLPALLIALKHGVDEPREEPLTLVGPPGLSACLRAISDAIGAAFLEQDFPVSFVELDRERDLDDGRSGVVFRGFPTPHTEESVAFVLETVHGALAYTGDTGPSESLGAFLAGSRVLIAECSHPDPPRTDRHLTPRGLAALATAVRPELLVVTHVYPGQTPADAVARVADGYDGRVVAARDGLQIGIFSDAVAVDLPAGRR